MNISKDKTIFRLIYNLYSLEIRLDNYSLFLFKFIIFII